MNEPHATLAPRVSAMHAGHSPAPCATPPRRGPVPKLLPKLLYSYILKIIYVISEENELLLPYPSHLKNVTALPCKMHKLFIFFVFSHIEYQSAIRMSYGSSVLLRLLNFRRLWWTMQLSVAKKTGIMYPCRRWSLQPVLSRATNANQQPAFFRANAS